MIQLSPPLLPLPPLSLSPFLPFPLLLSFLPSPLFPSTPSLSFSPLLPLPPDLPPLLQTGRWYHWMHTRRSFVPEDLRPCQPHRPETVGGQSPQSSLYHSTLSPAALFPPWDASKTFSYEQLLAWDMFIQMQNVSECIHMKITNQYTYANHIYQSGKGLVWG